MRSTYRVIKKVLTNNRLMKLPRRVVGFTPTRKAFPAGWNGEFRDVLFGNFMSLLLVNTFLITLYVLLITMTTNFQFLLEAVLSFIFPL